MNDDIFHISRAEIEALSESLDKAIELVKALRAAGIGPHRGSSLMIEDEFGSDPFGRNTLTHARNILDRFDQGGR